MSKKKQSQFKSDGGRIAIYHCVFAHEGFEESAHVLFKLVRDAQERQPGAKRLLYLDIDEHRNSEGGFDADMLELQQEFLIEFFGAILDRNQRASCSREEFQTAKRRYSSRIGHRGSP